MRAWRISITLAAAIFGAALLAAEMEDLQTYSMPSKRTVLEAQAALSEGIQRCSAVAKCDSPRPDGSAVCQILDKDGATKLGKVDLIPTGGSTQVIVSIAKRYPPAYRESQLRIWLSLVEGRPGEPCPKNY